MATSQQGDGEAHEESEEAHEESEDVSEVDDIGKDLSQTLQDEVDEGADADDEVSHFISPSSNAPVCCFLLLLFHLLVDCRFFVVCMRWCRVGFFCRTLATVLFELLYSTL